MTIVLPFRLFLIFLSLCLLFPHSRIKKDFLIVLVCSCRGMDGLPLRTALILRNLVAPLLPELDLVVYVLLDLEVAVFDVECILRVDLDGLQEISLETLPLRAVSIIQEMLPYRLIIVEVLERRSRYVLDTL